VPLVRLETTEKLEPDRRVSLCARLSKICAETIGKPEEYQMAIVADGLTVHFGGKPGPAAFVDIRSFGGLTPKVNQALSSKLCRLLEEELHVPSARVYLNMANVRADDWGHDGSTFGA
jgi:phenylpyruvate tautomerase